MPRISLFLGISIYMYWSDHAPPHFHAVYNEYGGAVDIRTGKVISGELPKRVKKLIREWAKLHEAELLQNWEFARNEEELVNIEPLE
jgi:hypothetical protein